MTTGHNGVEDEVARIGCIPYIEKDKTISTEELRRELNEDVSTLKQGITFENAELTMLQIVCDHVILMKKLANLRGDIRDTKDKCFPKTYGGNNEAIEQRID